MADFTREKKEKKSFHTKRRGLTSSLLHFRQKKRQGKPLPDAKQEREEELGVVLAARLHVRSKRIEHVKERKGPNCYL